MEHLGNPFEEESKDLIVLHSKEIAWPSAVEAVRKAKQIGEHKFEAFTREWLVERTKLDDTIPRDKLAVFGISTVRRISKNSNWSLSNKTWSSFQSCTLPAGPEMETFMSSFDTRTSHVPQCHLGLKSGLIFFYAWKMFIVTTLTIPRLPSLF